MNNEQKTFRDFFGKDIKVEDRVLHLWATVVNFTIRGGESSIRHKLAKVVRFSKKGVRIEWRSKYSQPLKQSTIFNTRNRLIILKNDILGIDEETLVIEARKEYESYKKGMKTRTNNLWGKTKTQETRIEMLLKDKDKLKKEIKNLTAEVNRFKNSIYRFELLDL